MEIDSKINPGSPHQSGQMHFLYEVISLKVEHSTKDVTGPVKCGWLRLRAALKRLVLVQETYHKKDNRIMLVDGVRISERIEPGQFLPGVALDPPYMDNASQAKSNNVYCMPAREPQQRSKLQDLDAWASGSR
jgi:hypothetical protein